MDNLNTGMTKELSPLQKAVAARNLFIATIYVCNGMAKGNIPLSTFNEPIVFAPNNEKIAICKNVWNERDLSIIEHNLLQGIIGVCCTALDEALDSKFGEKPMQYSNSDIDNLRAIIYMIRCAFAHTPTSPVWQINKRYQKSFHINELNITMNFEKLDKKRLVMADHNGLTGFCKLMDFCVRVINANDPK